MDFDINEVLSDMLKAVKLSVEDSWDETKVVANQFFERRKERLELIAELRITGKMSQEDFESRMEDEKLVGEAELHAIAVISKAMAQKAINAAIEVLSKAVKAAIIAI